MGGVGCWPLSPQGRGKQGWFWASDNHQFWLLLHGDTKPHLAVPGEGPCFFHLSCGASAPQEWPSFLIISESGDSSEMLWEVAERGVEGHAAEGVEVCMAERVAVV